jgi:hypothetical protein
MLFDNIAYIYHIQNLLLVSNRIFMYEDTNLGYRFAIKLLFRDSCYMVGLNQ